MTVTLTAYDTAEQKRYNLLLEEWQRIRDDRDTCCDLLYSLLEARTLADTELAARRARTYLLTTA